MNILTSVTQIHNPTPFDLKYFKAITDVFLVLNKIALLSFYQEIFYIYNQKSVQRLQNWKKKKKQFESKTSKLYELKLLCASDKILKRQRRIVGGYEAEIKEFPYLVQLLEYVPDCKAYKFVCAGTIIHKRWVLTAGQCFFYTNGVRVDRKLFFILAGTNVPIGFDDNEFYPVDRAIEHQKYNGSTFSNDIGLLHVRTCLE